MTGEVLLDTNIVIALLEREPLALAHFESDLADSISVITLGELLFGAEKSERVAVNRSRAEAFADDARYEAVIARRRAEHLGARRGPGRASQIAWHLSDLEEIGCHRSQHSTDSGGRLSRSRRDRA